MLGIRGGILVLVGPWACLDGLREVFGSTAFNSRPRWGHSLTARDGARGTLGEKTIDARYSLESVGTPNRHGLFWAMRPVGAEAGGESMRQVLWLLLGPGLAPVWSHPDVPVVDTTWLLPHPYAIAMRC